MEDFATLPTDQLLERMLSHTATYTRLIKEGATDNELSNCEFVLNMIQSEIKLRQSSPKKNEVDSNKA